MKHGPLFAILALLIGLPALLYVSHRRVELPDYPESDDTQRAITSSSEAETESCNQRAPRCEVAVSPQVSAQERSSFDESVEMLRTPTGKGPGLDGCASAIRAFAASLNENPAWLGFIIDLINTDDADPEFIKRLIVSLGQSSLPAAHRVLTDLMIDTTARRAYRTTAVAALGQRRGDSVQGNFVLLSGDVVFGYSIEEPALLRTLLDTFRNGLDDPEDEARGALRSRLAHVLSGSVKDPQVVQSLGEALPSAGNAELGSILNALTAAEPREVRPFEREFRRILADSTEGEELGHAAALLLVSAGPAADPDIRAAFGRLLAGADRESAAHEAAEALSVLTSSLKLEFEHHRWLREFAVFLAGTPAFSGNPEFRRFVLIAMATSVDTQLQSPGASRVLELLSDPTIDGTSKVQVVSAVQFHRLDAGAVRKMMEALKEGGATLTKPALTRIGASISTARAIGDAEIVKWAIQLDTLAGSGDAVTALVRTLRQRMAEGTPHDHGSGTGD
jgi:hypothetical protein